jgi:hypothetical protein
MYPCHLSIPALRLQLIRYDSKRIDDEQNEPKFDGMEGKEVERKF